jgi:hypothetical protein
MIVLISSMHLLARSLCWLFTFVASGLTPYASLRAASNRVTLIRTPDGGIQPQAVVDARGIVHLIYYKGESGGGDLFYGRRPPGEKAFSQSVRVNTSSKSAIAAGTIRGAQIAVGRKGRVHFAWNGHAPEGGNYMQAPMLYTRLNDAGTAFEPERDVITSARGLDGGGSVAADKAGNVYVMWHAPKPGNTNGEAGRALFVARSSDDGKTFAPEKLATSESTGACACCGMKAYADDQGNLFALYRAASEKVNRDELLLISCNRGDDFEIAFSHPWKLPSCPMSSACFSETQETVLAAWETESNVYFARVNRKLGTVSRPESPPGMAKRKHPVIVGNAQGDFLFVWTEGTGWNRGGAVAWQLYHRDGKPAAEKGRADGVPVWSLATAFAGPDGSFTIVY